MGGGHMDIGQLKHELARQEKSGFGASSEPYVWRTRKSQALWSLVSVVPRYLVAEVV